MSKSNTNIIRQVGFAALLLSTSILGGCMNDGNLADQAMEPVAYSGSEAYPITVAKGPVTLDVDSHQGTLSPAQINAVSGFAHQARQAGVTPVTISRPSGGGASARVASEVASLVSQQGVSRNMIRIGTYSGPASAPVHVSYISTYAKTKPCGQVTQDATETENNTHMSSHGCAVQSNIAAMVADPETLVVPSAVDPIRANTRVNAIRGLERDTSRDSAPWWSIFN
jgi:pilus assembly protein CpaD